MSITIKHLLSFIGMSFKMSAYQMMEYKISSIVQIITMMLSDLTMLIIWYFFFQRFPIVNGWTIDDMMLLWASIPISFGISVGVFANVLGLPAMISQGQLDYYLVMPKPVLLHILVSKIDVFNLGDIVFGVVLVFFTSFSWYQIGIFFLFTLFASVIFLSMLVMVGSLSFFWGNTTGLQKSTLMSVTAFSTYPMSIFGKNVKLILFTIIPAGWIGFMPVEIARNLLWSQMVYMLIATLVFFSLMIYVFHKGLKRYESGNMLAMRG